MSSKSKFWLFFFYNFSAGVWHNFILVILAVACIQVHPIFLKTFFDNKVHIRNVIDVSYFLTIFILITWKKKLKNKGFSIKNTN